MRILYRLFFILIILIFFLFLSSPKLYSENLIYLKLPESFYKYGFKPAGINKSENGLLLAGNVMSEDGKWGIALVWFSNDFNFIDYKILDNDNSENLVKVATFGNDLFLLYDSPVNKKNKILQIGIRNINLKNSSVSWKRNISPGDLNYAKDFTVNREEQTVTILGWFDVTSNKDKNIRYGGWDIIVASYTLDGVLLWSKVLGGKNDDIPGAIISDEAGIAVCYNSWNKKTKWDSFWVYFNKEGKIIYKKTFRSRGSEIISGIVKTEDDGFILCGTTDTPDDVWGEPDGKEDFLVIKISKNGKIEWKRRFGGSESEFSGDIYTAKDGTYWMVGTTLSSDKDIKGHIGGFDLALLRISKDGMLLEEKTIGTMNDDFYLKIIKNKDCLIIASYNQISKYISYPVIFIVSNK